MATFRADWLTRRDSRSCYLRLPSLVGPGTLVAAAMTEEVFEIGEGFVDDDFASTNREAATAGITTVDVIGGHLDVERSRPAPPDATRAAWNCNSQPQARLRLGLRRRPGYSVERVKRFNRPEAGCRATAVLEEDGGETRTSFLLVLYGTLLALGMTFVADALLDPFKRREWGDA